jgi:hypothetical protein
MQILKLFQCFTNNPRIEDEVSAFVDFFDFFFLSGSSLEPANVPEEVVFDEEDIYRFKYSARDNVLVLVIFVFTVFMDFIC